MLNRNGENEHPYFIAGLRGKVFSVSQLNMITMGFPHMAFYYDETDSFSIHQ